MQQKHITMELLLKDPPLPPFPPLPTRTCVPINKVSLIHS